ncbi:MAG: AzlD domain-containing protein [Gammaproteobacteria bacterium]|nr:AzlD domain-containing protein [Gammaproteobacteria bacterium]MBU1646833.1 AzlD domain-containing protein [Gammaproteobacteria bacterium]MBU1971668.1 AzlD domain-containing protein [Gammaproteobacteria bacterium]
MNWTDWLPLWLACGLLTFAIRYSFIGLEGRYRPPGWFVRWLPYVPIAALTALATPELLLDAGNIQLGADNPRLWAGLVAIAVAARWRNTLLTIAAGFAALGLLRWLGDL